MNDELRKQLEFETLLADISARFVRLPGDQVDSQISAAERRICEFLGLDVATLWQVSPDHPGSLRMTHIHRPPDFPALPEVMDAERYCPWGLEVVRRGEHIALSRLSDAPPAAARDLELLRHYGIESILSLPLSAGGRTGFGALNFCVVGVERPWPPALVNRLQLLADVFASALARKLDEQSLGESETRLSLAIEAADAGPWELDVKAARFWLSPKIHELFGLAPATELTVESLLALVHPEDRRHVREAMDRALGSAALSVVEYRIVRPDGEVRWMVSRGRLAPGAPGPRLMGITADISARKAAEERQRLNEQRLAAAVDIAELGFYESGEDLGLSFMDERARALTGMCPGEEAGRRDFWVAHLHPEDQPRVLEISRELREGGKERSATEYRYLHPMRGTIWLSHLSQVLARDATGRATRMAGVLQDITARRQAEEALRKALDEVRQLRDRLQNENVYLRQEMKVCHGHSRIVAASAPMRRVMDQVQQVAATGSTVLLLGETGTGKELLASAIHDLSPRRDRAMVSVNCAAIPAALIESELFGREKGAYTGALSRQVGRFELADGSTLFLDEIGDMPPEVQAKLLRVLQDRRFERLGNPKSIAVDVRIVAATNQDLEKAVRERRFRQDLYYRLNVFPIKVPPLREHREDIPALVAALVGEFAGTMGRQVDTVCQTSIAALARYSWPGNVRELRNVVERAMITATGRTLVLALPEADSAPASGSLTMRDAEANHIRSVLELTGWRVRGKGGAAELLQMKPSTLESRMAKFGIRRPPPA
ncbi:MAG: sigma 54-interacting transcriptional regulator [Lentisphaeria bacterium]|nr:sigma 54-interacting transcriptional regulator [Lentisphaeria bacterium]